MLQPIFPSSYSKFHTSSQRQRQGTFVSISERPIIFPFRTGLNPGLHMKVRSDGTVHRRRRAAHRDTDRREAVFLLPCLVLFRGPDVLETGDHILGWKDVRTM